MSVDGWKRKRREERYEYIQRREESEIWMGRLKVIE